MSLREKLIRALGGEMPEPEDEPKETCPKCGRENVCDVTCVDDREPKRLCGECGARWILNGLG